MNKKIVLLLQVSVWIAHLQIFADFGQALGFAVVGDRLLVLLLHRLHQLLALLLERLQGRSQLLHVLFQNIHQFRIPLQ